MIAGFGGFEVSVDGSEFFLSNTEGGVVDCMSKLFVLSRTGLGLGGNGGASSVSSSTLSFGEGIDLSMMNCLMVS